MNTSSVLCFIFGAVIWCSSEGQPITREILRQPFRLNLNYKKASPYVPKLNLPEKEEKIVPEFQEPQTKPPNLLDDELPRRNTKTELEPEAVRIKLETMNPPPLVVPPKDKPTRLSRNRKHKPTTTATTTTTEEEYDYYYLNDGEVLEEIVTTARSPVFDCPNSNSKCKSYCQSTNFFSGYCNDSVCQCYGYYK